MGEYEEIVKTWIGPKNTESHYNKMQNGGFNWAAFFIPDLYFLTRKMWLEAFSYIFIIIALYYISFLPFMYYPVRLSIIGIRIGIGFLFYKLYKMSIIRKIKRNERRGYSFEQQIEDARKRGGDKVTIAVIANFIICTIIIVEAFIIPIFIKNFIKTYLGLATQSSYIVNSNGMNTWDFEKYYITYDSELWQGTENSGVKTLKYKDSNNSVFHVVLLENRDCIEMFDELKDKPKAEQKKFLEDEGIKVNDISFERINAKIGKITIDGYNDGKLIKAYMFTTNNETIMFFSYINEQSTKFDIDFENVIKTFTLKDSNNSSTNNNTNINNKVNTNNNLNNSNTVRKLSYDIPKVFKESYISDDYRSYNSEEDVTSDTFVIECVNAEYYNSIKDYLKSTMEVFSNNNGIEKENINGLMWDKVVAKETYGTCYFYVIEKEGYIYELNYVEYTDSSKSYVEEIKHSLRF